MARHTRIERSLEGGFAVGEGGSLLERERLQPAPRRGRHAGIGEGERVRRTRVPEQSPEARPENGQIVVRENDDVHGVGRAPQRWTPETNGRKARNVHETGVRRGRGGPGARGPVACDSALQPPPGVAQPPEEAHHHRGDARARLGELGAGLLELLGDINAQCGRF